MKVTDQQRWTRAKKKIVTVCILTGIFLSFGIESSMWWALPAIVLSATSVMVLNTIQRHEW